MTTEFVSRSQFRQEIDTSNPSIIWLQLNLFDEILLLLSILQSGVR